MKLFLYFFFQICDTFLNETVQNNSRGNQQLTIICKMLDIVNTATWKPKFSPDLLSGQLITRRCDEITFFFFFYIFLICDMFWIDNV